LTAELGQITTEIGRRVERRLRHKMHSVHLCRKYTGLLDAGADICTVQEVPGHSDDSTTKIHTRLW
jgi:site-specific recombinase XerD